MGKSCVFIAFRNSYWLFSCNFDPLIIQVLLMNLDKKNRQKNRENLFMLAIFFFPQFFTIFFTRKNLHNKWTKIINKLSRIFHLLCQFFNGFSDLNLQIEGVKIHDNSFLKEAILWGWLHLFPAVLRQRLSIFVKWFPTRLLVPIFGSLAEDETRDKNVTLLSTRIKVKCA